MPGDAPITHPRLHTGPQPGSNPFQETSVLSPLPGWSLQGCPQQAAGMWPPFLFRRRGLALVGDSMALSHGREMGGWMAACCGPWSRHSLRKHCLGAKEQHCESCSPTTFFIAQSSEWWGRNCSVKREGRKRLDITETAAFKRRVICLIHNLSPSIRAGKVRSCWKLTTHMVTLLHH